MLRPVVFRWPTPALSLAVCLLLFGFVSAGTSATPSQARSAAGRVGISTSIWMTPANEYNYLRRARDAGITWAREDFTWSSIEPTRGRFSWRRTDALMRNVARLGMHVLAIADYAPTWATGHTDSDKYPPVNARHYAIFVKAIADRYGARGTFWRANPRLVPSPVTAIELWNEPWLASFWGPVPDANAYARLVRAAASAVKRVHPEITVLVSGDVPEESEGVGVGWFQTLLKADPALWRSGLINAWSVHLYCHELSPWDGTSPQRARFDRLLLTRSLAQQAGADLPIWITEFGWNTDPNAPDAVSEETQASYVRQALVRVETEWRSFVRRSFVFTWTTPSPSPDDRYNLVRPDGSARPAWYAIQSFITSGT